MQRKKGSILLYQTFAFLLVRVRGLELLQKRRSSAALCQNYNMRRAEFVFANKNKRVEFARLHINAKKQSRHHLGACFAFLVRVRGLEPPRSCPH